MELLIRVVIAVLSSLYKCFAQSLLLVNILNYSNIIPEISIITQHITSPQSPKPPLDNISNGQKRFQLLIQHMNT